MGWRKYNSSCSREDLILIDDSCEMNKGEKYLDSKVSVKYLLLAVMLIDSILTFSILMGQ